MTYTQEGLDALIASIDAGDVGALPITDTLPEGAAGQVMLAARAAKRAREEVAEAIGYACAGDAGEALRAVAEAERDLAMMRKRLDSARQLKALP